MLRTTWQGGTAHSTCYTTAGCTRVQVHRLKVVQPRHFNTPDPQGALQSSRPRPMRAMKKLSLTYSHLRWRQPHFASPKEARIGTPVTHKHNVTR